MPAMSVSTSNSLDWLSDAMVTAQRAAGSGRWHCYDVTSTESLHRRLREAEEHYTRWLSRSLMAAFIDADRVVRYRFMWYQETRDAAWSDCWIGTRLSVGLTYLFGNYTVIIYGPFFSLYNSKFYLYLCGWFQVGLKIQPKQLHNMVLAEPFLFWQETRGQVIGVAPYYIDVCVI